MINFKLIYFNKDGVSQQYLIENAQLLPSINDNLVVYVNEIQEFAIVYDIVHFFKEGKSEIVVYSRSRYVNYKPNCNFKTMSHLNMSNRLFNCLNYYYQHTFGKVESFSNLPATEIFKINVEEMAKSRMVGTKTIAEFKQILIDYNYLRHGLNHTFGS